VLLLHNKDQQQMSPYKSFTSYFGRERSGYSLSLHDTRPVNLARVQFECHTGKWTVIARIKSIGIKLL